MSQKLPQKSSGGRTLVNVLGIPSILLMIYIGGLPFWGFVTIVSILCLREFYQLGKHQDIHPQFVAGYLVSFLITLYFFFGPAHPLTFIRPSEFLVILTPYVVLAEIFRAKPNAMSNISMTLSGILYIPFLLGTMVGIREIDPISPDMGMKLTFCLFMGIWMCDSAAYIIGKQWGERKLIERVSPKKTVIGAIGGLLFTFVFFFIIMKTKFLVSEHSTASLHLTDFLMLTFIIGIIGQAGDFAESLLKRDIGVKDTSSFLAGHGGILDRFDSLIIASPAMFIYVKHFVY